MKTNDGKQARLAFPPRVIEEVIAKFKVGDPMIVIYRQISDSDKRVTAVAFPGSAATPIYVNTTGSRVLVRTSPMVGGVCGQPDAGPISESIFPPTAWPRSRRRAGAARSRARAASRATSPATAALSS